MCHETLIFVFFKPPSGLLIKQTQIYKYGLNFFHDVDDVVVVVVNFAVVGVDVVVVDIVAVVVNIDVIVVNVDVVVVIVFVVNIVVVLVVVCTEIGLHSAQHLKK